MVRTETTKTKEELRQDTIDRIVGLYFHHYNEWTDRNDQVAKNNSMVRPDGQWSDDDRRRLAGEFRPCITINKIGPLVRQMLGLMLQNEITLKVERVGAEDDAVAEVLTGILSHVLYNEDADYINTLVEADGIIGGTGFYFIRIKVDPITDKRSFDIDCQNNTEIYLDPNARNIMQKDWKGMQREIWMSSDEIMDEWGKEKDLDGSKLLSKEDFSVNEFNGFWKGIIGRFKSLLRDSTPIDKISVYQHGMYKVMENWYVRIVDTDIWVHEYDGTYTTIEPELNDGRWIPKTAKLPKITVAHYYPYADKLLDEKDYGYKYFPTSVFTPMNLGLKIIDSQGYVEDLIGIQEELNISRSIMAEILAKGANGALLFRKGDEALREDMIEHGSTPGYKGITLSDVGAPVPVEMQIPGGLYQSQALNDKDWIDLGLIPPASRGMTEGSGESGKLYSLKILQGSTAIAMIMKNWILCQRMKGKIILEMIPDVYDKEDVIEILGEKRWNKIIEREPNVWELIQKRTYAKYDVTIEETPMTKSQRQDEFAGFSESVKSLPDEFKAVLAPEIVRLMSLPNAEAIATKFDMLIERMYGLSQMPQVPGQEGGQPQQPGTPSEQQIQQPPQGDTGQPPVAP